MNTWPDNIVRQQRFKIDNTNKLHVRCKLSIVNYI